MKKASEILTQAEVESLQQTVADAEKKTSAEIVPVMASASGRYDRGEDMFGLLVGVAALVATMILFPSHSQPTWGEASTNWLHIAFCCVAILMGYIFGTAVATNVGRLKLLLTPRREIQAEVKQRAVKMFAANRVYNTHDASGLLIYVSLLERMVVIYADWNVLEKLGQPALDELRDDMIAKLRKGLIADAFRDTITKASDRLAAVLPIQPGDVNELPNELVIID